MLMIAGRRHIAGNGIMRRLRGFTLIELLVVVAIIALLLSIMMPSLSAVRESGKSAKCKHNLHQIGVAMQAYFSVHNDIFPCIAVLPSNEENAARDEGNRKPYDPMTVVLKKETHGNTEVFECPSDEVRNDDPGLRDIGVFPGRRYFDTENTSYEWNPFLNPDYDLENDMFGPQKRRRVRGTGLVLDIFLTSLANLQMIREFESFHRGLGRKSSINFLYADLHVDSTSD